MKTRNRLSRFVALGVLSLTPFVSHATIYTLAPGTFTAGLGTVYPTGGAVVDTITSPFASPALEGTLTSTVISGDASNPYAGGLTFTYQFDLSGLSAHPSSQLSISSFTGLMTDVSYNTAGGVAPSHVSRSIGDGDVVRFHFLVPSVAPGSQSALLVVQTDATDYSPVLAGLINGQTVNVVAFAPFVIPEPGTATLLVAGLGLLALRRKLRA